MARDLVTIGWRVGGVYDSPAYILNISMCNEVAVKRVAPPRSKECLSFFITATVATSRHWRLPFAHHFYYTVQGCCPPWGGVINENLTFIRDDLIRLCWCVGLFGQLSRSDTTSNGRIVVRKPKVKPATPAWKANAPITWRSLTSWNRPSSKMLLIRVHISKWVLYALQVPQPDAIGDLEVPWHVHLVVPKSTAMFLEAVEPVNPNHHPLQRP